MSYAHRVSTLESATLPSLLTLSVVSHGQGDLLAGLLDDLSRHHGLAGLPVVVTLNLPEPFDATRWPALDITVRRNTVRRGFGANHNAAFGDCRTPWFAVINPDLRLPVDPFPSLVATAAALPNPGVVAPCIVDSAGHTQDSVRANPTPWSVARRVFDRRIGRGDTAGFFWLAGMFLLFSADAFRRVGGFDEGFFLYYEDYDVCARLQKQGFSIAVDRQANAVHDAQRQSHRSARYLRWHVSSLLRVWTSGVFWWALLGRGRSGRGKIRTE
jgi:N-acetylglucosaminyl-diphospho-decaprenol L-rhamnosyltransferase